MQCTQGQLDETLFMTQIIYIQRHE